MPNGQEIERGFGKLVSLNVSDPAQGLVLRQSSEEFGWYIVDGMKQFRVSSKARRSGGIGRGRLSALRKYLGLTNEQFKDLCQCPMTGPQCHQIIRDSLGL